MASDSTSIELSIVIPAFNEAGRLPATLAAVEAAVASWPFATQVVVVDDGSKDATPTIIASHAASNPAITPVICPENRGKGAAVMAGVAATTGRWVLFFDADLSYPLEAVPKALVLLRDGADVVIGARNLDPANGRADYGPVRTLTSHAFNGFVQAVLGLGIQDTQCGFKAFRGDVARGLFPTLSIRGFGFDVELLFAARRRGLRIALMPIRMTGRDGSSVRVFRHGLQMARDVLRIRARSWRGHYPRGR
jgi:dolichyl-phosphate beta-glucosyltransferase